MALFARQNTGDTLETNLERRMLSGELEQGQRHETARAAKLRQAVLVGFMALTLAGLNSQQIADGELTLQDMSAERLKAQGEYELALQQQAVTAKRMSDQTEARQVELDPYQNEREIVILQNEPVVQAHRDYIEATAEEFAINVNHLVATGMVESCFNADISDSRAGAEGAFQVMPEYVDWFRELYGDGEYDPSNIEHSIRMGAAALAMTSRAVDVDIQSLTDRQKLLVVGTAYNAGHTRANRLIAADFDVAQLGISETESHLAELQLIFDEWAQDGTETSRC